MTDRLHFLLTDIEGSTRSWEREPDSMRAAVARHDGILRRAIEEHGGRVFKQVGDGVWATFDRAGAAVAAAVDAQRALTTTSWETSEQLRVRMAVHTVSISDLERRDGDLFGPELSRCARLVDIAHGGQVIVSHRARQQATDVVPVDFQDLGPHRLRDLREPEYVHQVVVADLPRDFPPLRSLDSFPHNLPVQRSSFIGREEELEQLIAMLDAQRLVTLTGAGGAGKTRLALAAAAELVHRCGDGVWFVDLASVRDATLVVPHVATAIGIREQANRPLLDVLIDYLRTRQLLLLLDNCEHLVGACAELVDRMLASAPGLRVLVTSRERLGVPGEQVESLAPLPIDARDDAAPGAAVRLFLDRAIAVAPDLRLQSDDLAVIERICRRLDGSPLAIELAAARLTVLSPGELLGRLDDRFRLLTGGHRTAVPQHQTLRATLDWSYDLLASREQILFRRLAVFSAPAPLEAVEAVVSDANLPSAEVLDGLDGLVSKSLLGAERTRAGTRYGMLETVREYAFERLVESGEAATFQDAHVNWLLALAAEVREEQTHTTLVRSATLPTPDVRSGLEWLRSTRPAAAVELATSVSSTWFVTGHLAEARQHLEQALGGAGDEIDPGVRARAHTGLAVLAVSQGDVGVAERYARPLVEAGGRYRSRVMCLWVVGTAAWIRGHTDTSLARHREGMALAQELGYGNGERLHLVGCARALVSSGELDEASEIYEQMLRLPDEDIRPDERVWALDGLARVACLRGDLDRAEVLALEALELYEDLGYAEGMNSALDVLGLVAVESGRLEAARGHLSRGVHLAHRMGHRGALAATLGVCAALALAEDDAVRAARLVGHVEALREQLEAGDGTDDLIVGRVRALLSSVLGDALEGHRTEGRMLSTDVIVQTAIPAT